MLTIFSTPKPFDGHIGIIQRNAIRSWTLLDPTFEVILFGDEPGTADAARALGIRHEPEVRRNERGSKFLSYLFERAQQIAAHELLCYANCDIILMGDFREAVERTASLGKPFLMVGRRWNLDIHEPWDFSAPGWAQRLRRHALQHARRARETFMDYFVFRRGFYRDLPPFVLGPPYWDPWLVWKAFVSGAPVLDASAVTMAIHQNHTYSHYPGGWQALFHGPETQHNLRLAPMSQRRTLAGATLRLTPRGIEPNRARWVVAPALATERFAEWLWYSLMAWSKPFRHKVGLHRSSQGAADH